MLLFLCYPCMGILIMIGCFIVLVYSYNLILTAYSLCISQCSPALIGHRRTPC